MVLTWKLAAGASNVPISAQKDSVPALTDARNITALAISFAEWNGARALFCCAIGVVGRQNASLNGRKSTSCVQADRGWR